MIPSVREWYQQYQDEGLVVIGVHYPEFKHERDIDNLRAALDKYNVPYPVVVDNERIAWDAYENRFWPTFYLIDKRGDIRFVHIGDRDLDMAEQVIKALLAEPYAP